jgi:DNA polymerase-4/protein ImuB
MTGQRQAQRRTTLALGYRTTDDGQRATQRLTSDLAVCLWIPLFPLRCEERRRPELQGKPAALLAPTDSRRIWQISASARRAGVRAGMTVSQAIGACASLTLCEPDPVAYDEAFTRLLLALERVSPVIEPVELGRAFVGVDGLERLYGTPAHQLRVIARTVLHSPVAGRSDAPAFRLGYARGKFAAWVAAARAKPNEPVIVPDDHRIAFLEDQPVAALPVSPDTHRRLRQLGLERLGAVARLPEVAMVSQFGNEGRRAWQLATGRQVDPVTGHVRPEPITATLHFPQPAADRGMLDHALRMLVERALRHPRRTGWRVQIVRLRASLEHGASWLAEAALKDPSAHGDRIVAPLLSRLDQSPPTGAVDQLAVEFTAFVRGTDELQLFARDATSTARAGRRHALTDAAREILLRLKRPLLHHVIEVQPWSRIPERRYALIDFEP